LALFARRQDRPLAAFCPAPFGGIDAPRSGLAGGRAALDHGGMDMHTHGDLDGVAPTPRRIALVHGHALLAAGLAATLSRWGHEVQAWAPSAARADLLVADRAAALRLLNHGEVSCGVLVLDLGFSGAEARRLLDLGALACLEAQCSLAELARAVHAVAIGAQHLCGVVCAALADDMTQVKLTSREHQVLQLVCEGLDNKSIARRLSLAPTTVKTHVKALLAKTAARSRTQMAATAWRKGWA
jgi:DNA-binding NarL/FixJ family response regulator